MCLSERSSCIRLSMGFLAHPKPDIIAWNALSPLQTITIKTSLNWRAKQSRFSIDSPNIFITTSIEFQFGRDAYVGLWALHWWMYWAIRLSSPVLWCSTTSWNLRRMSGRVFCTTHCPYDPAAEQENFINNFKSKFSFVFLIFVWFFL